MSAPPPLLEMVDADLEELGRGKVSGFGMAVNAGEVVVAHGAPPAMRALVARAALGLLRPRQGRVLLFGTDLAQTSTDALWKLRARCALASPAAPLLSNQSVRDNVSLPRLVHTSASGTLNLAVEELLACCEVAPVAALRPEALEPAAHARALLARALAVPAALFVLDVGAIPRAAQAVLEAQVAEGAGVLLLLGGHGDVPWGHREIDLAAHRAL